MIPWATAGEQVAHAPRMRALSLGLLAFLLALAPGAASAVTLDQIVTLTKSGVSEPIILALIDRDKTVFTIEPEQLVALQRDGVSEKVILAMLKSGRAEGDDAARTDSAFNAATIMSTLSPAPEVVIVGHSPQRPDTGYFTGFWSGPPVQDAIAVPPIAYGFAGFTARARRHVPQQRDVAPPLSTPALCYAQTTSSSVPPMVGSMGMVTVCPEPLQPKRAR
jgi:hypothetical protein